MPRKLKLWNGRGQGTKFSHHHVYVAAYSVKQAAEIVGKACHAFVTENEIRNYYNKDCWGNPMKGIEPTEPCVYIENKSYPKSKPIRIL